MDLGIGFGCMHYGVEVVPDEAGAEFKKWLGGHYENMRGAYSQLGWGVCVNGAEITVVQDFR